MEADRLNRIKILLESGTAQGNAAVVYQDKNSKCDSEFNWSSSKMEMEPIPVSKPIFQPHLDLINTSKSSEEELNVTKSSVGESCEKRLAEISDEDSGHSSANSSGNEETKKLMNASIEEVIIFLICNYYFFSKFVIIFFSKFVIIILFPKLLIIIDFRIK